MILEDIRAGRVNSLAIFNKKRAAALKVNPNTKHIIYANILKNKTRGGARKGAGAKKKEPTKVLSWRVPVKLAPQVKKAVDPVVEEIIKKRKK